MTARGLRRHARILAYVRGSLERRWRKNASVVVVYGLTIFALAVVVFLTESLTGEAVLRLRSAPEITVQKLGAGRHSLVPEAVLASLVRITGVRAGQSRLWAYYADSARGETLVLVVPPGTPLRDDEARVGWELMERKGIGPGEMLALRTAAGETARFVIVSPAGAETDLESAAVVQLSESAFRKVAGIPEGLATDLALRVRNPRELTTIAKKITQAHPDLRPIVRDELIRTYRSVFQWRSGVVVGLLLVPVLAFVLFAWDKAAGLSAEERREIGILEAIGWETGDVLAMKCYEALAVSVTAFALGAGLAGLALVASRSPVISVLAGWSTLYPAVAPAVTVGAYEVATLFFLSVVPYLVATVVPGWRAATIDPDLVMRG